MSDRPAYWILEKTQNPRFPFRLSIRQADEDYIILRTQDSWPGSRKNIFCLRETSSDPNEELEEVERIRIISLKQFGKRLSVVLDRSIKKRCDFLFLIKKYTGKDKEYEQIFWQTQKSLVEKRPKIRFANRNKYNHKVVIDPNEKYAWRFPSFKEVKASLPVGDYAILVENDIKAIIERKTYENIVRDFSDMQILHQKLSELESYPNSALVIEADYSDFLKVVKIQKTPFSVSYVTKALAEISALHPKLSVIFSGSRKLANEWCRAYFQELGNIKNESASLFRRHEPDVTGRAIFFEIRKKLLSHAPNPFGLNDLNSLFSENDIAQVKKTLRTMQNWGDIKKEGRGKAARWLISKE